MLGYLEKIFGCGIRILSLERPFYNASTVSTAIGFAGITITNRFSNTTFIQIFV